MSLLKEQIDFQLSLILCEASSGFDIRVFKSLETQQEQLSYAASFLKKLGAGSSRTVFYLSNRYVLKIARHDKKGPAQNKAEVDIYTSPKLKPVVAKIYDFDGKRYNWLISEVVRELAAYDEFKELAGFSFDILCMYINSDKPIDVFIEEKTEYYNKEIARAKNNIENNGGYRNSENKWNINYIRDLTENIQELKGLTKNSALLIGTSEMMQSTGLLAGDVELIEHWGKTADGRVVLMDYGYTEEVYNSTYRRH